MHEPSRFNTATKEQVRSLCAMQEVRKASVIQASLLCGLQKTEVPGVWCFGDNCCGKDLCKVYEKERKGVSSSMDFGEFLFLCGVAITLGMSMTFGGLFGWAVFETLREVFRR